MQATTYTLNEQQAHAYDLVVHQHQNICVSAIAGTGKTYLANAIIEALADQGYEVLSCAFTGAAASLVDGGITAHKASGLRLGASSVLPPGVPKEGRLHDGQTRLTLVDAAISADARWCAQQLLVVLDEISQFSSEDAYLWYQAGMHKRYSVKKNKPTQDPIFLLLGDIGQFLPISGSLIFNPPVFTYWDQTTQTYITDSARPSIIDLLKPTVINLTQVMRQDDPKFIRALSWLHRGIAVHPCILDRVEAQVPRLTPKFYYNNKLVVHENTRRLSAYKQNKSQVYYSMGDRLTDSELAYLLPVAAEQTVYLNSPFTITVNVYDHKRDLIVANGEVVTVTGLKLRSIVVTKTDGSVHELSYVNHHLPFNHKDGKKKSFQALPGYPGDSASLMKVQGRTYKQPVCFAPWQIRSGNEVPLKISGALYTMCSRVTDLNNLYFDSSLGVDITKEYLKQSLTLDPTVSNIINGPKPLWLVDANRDTLVIEALSFSKPDLTYPDDIDSVWLVEYKHTCLKTGAEEDIICCITRSHTDEWALVAYGILDLQTNKIVQCAPKFELACLELAKRLIC